MYVSSLAYLSCSLFFFIIIAVVNGLVVMLMPASYNFHYTHWVFGRLTGLWEYDVLVDMGIAALGAGFILFLSLRRHFGE